MELLIAVVIAAVLMGIVAAVWRVRPFERTPRPTVRPRQQPRITAPVTTLVLDVHGGDPDSPSVQRLARSVALPVFERSADVEEVVVKDREGALVARIGRPEPAPEPAERGEVPFDLQLHPRSYEPAHEGVVPPPEGATDDPGHATAFADRFDLPPSVTAALRDPDDPVDVVRAILDAAGLVATVSGNSVLTDDLLLIVVTGTRGVVTREDLTHAYLRFESSRHPRGVAICLGYVDPDELRRRELLAPTLGHAGQDAIQRMADAVSLGADPLTFLEGPPVTSEI